MTQQYHFTYIDDLMRQSIKYMTEAVIIEKESARQEYISGVSALWSPGGVVMMIIAISVDVAEFFFDLIPIVGHGISFVIDILALLFFGAWILFRTGSIKISAKVMQWAKRLKWLRPVLAIFELIPIPIFESFTWWTILIYSELKRSP